MGITSLRLQRSFLTIWFRRKVCILECRVNADFLPVFDQILPDFSFQKVVVPERRVERRLFGPDFTILGSQKLVLREGRPKDESRMTFGFQNYSCFLG